MNWEALGAIAEFVGGVATVVTLVYLALQIRQNTRSVRAATIANYREGTAGYSRMIAENAALADLTLRGHQDPESLTPCEYHRYTNAMVAMITNLQEAEEYEASGILSESLKTSRNMQVDWLVSLPGFRKWWLDWGAASPPKFAHRIEAAIAASESLAASESGPDSLE
ncbi:hypothetical protein FV139_11295 [Parahaliea maris]|uniref:DUF4760 domain-containing protein n=1 Tax=Parahaliea maris TaxID=2716870 RepID=A0A5C8ZZZ8_9GAMM|nr:hypothetical protein [Parahaliea maris]TXS94175.1 hypothetical protein FV139_11295 [Parahaliea maris]